MNKFEIENVTIKEKIASLHKTNVLISLYTILSYWFLIFASSYLSIYVSKTFENNWLILFVYLSANLIIASRQRALENLIHEATHFNLSQNLRVNDGMAWFFLALPLSHNLKQERIMHVQGHHKCFWQPELDPDFERYKNMGLDALPAKSYLDLFKSLIICFPRYVIDVIPTFFIQKKQSFSIVLLRALYWSIILSVVYYLDLVKEFFYYWCLPFFITLTFIRFIAEVTEHASLGCTNEFFSSRNNLGWINEYLLHPAFDGYHIIHHLFPKIPFYNLKNAHYALLKDEIYKTKGCHCNSFFFSRSNNKSTIRSLIIDK